MNREERLLLEAMATELDAQHDNPKTDDRYRPGLRLAARRLRAKMRGDAEPVIVSDRRNRVYLSAEILFDGNYYDSGELANVCSARADNALAGMRDVRSVDVQAIVRAVE